MKRLYIFVAAIAMTAATAVGQTLRVWDQQNATAWIYDANTLLKTMPFEGEGININGYAHAASDGVWMTVDKSDYFDGIVANPDVVYVTGGEYPGLFVTAAGSLAPYLTVKADHALASYDITVSDAVQRELTFVLSGSAGSVAIHGNYKTTVILDGIDLHAYDGCKTPALWIDNGKRIEIQVKGKNTFADSNANEKKSAFFIKGHAEWKGDGTVSIAGSQRHAYSSNEYTQFKSSFAGTFTVTAAGSDGMHVDQYLEINGGTFNITGTKGDGIDVGCTLEADGVTPTKDEKNGEYLQTGGTVNVTVDETDTKGVKSEKTMTVTAGRINARTNGDGGRAVQAGTDLILGAEGADISAAYFYLGANGGTYKYTNEDGEADSSKCRGLKVKGDFYFYPSTLEYEAGLKVVGSKLVDVDGIFYNRGGKKNSAITFTPGSGTQN